MVSFILAFFAFLCLAPRAHGPMTPADEQYLRQHYEHRTFRPVVDGHVHTLVVHERLAAGARAVVFAGGESLLVVNSLCSY
jgi:hypothetical protein